MKELQKEKRVSNQKIWNPFFIGQHKTQYNTSGGSHAKSVFFQNSGINFTDTE